MKDMSGKMISTVLIIPKVVSTKYQYPQKGGSDGLM